MGGRPIAVKGSHPRPIGFAWDLVEATCLCPLDDGELSPSQGSTRADQDGRE
jgi:hypothetical protein